MKKVSIFQPLLRWLENQLWNLSDAPTWRVAYPDRKLSLRMPRREARRRAKASGGVAVFDNKEDRYSLTDARDIVPEPTEPGAYLWRRNSGTVWRRVDVTYIDGTDILQCRELDLDALRDTWEGMWAIARENE